MKYSHLHRKVMFAMHYPHGCLDWGERFKLQDETFARNCINCSDLYIKVMLPTTIHMGWDEMGVVVEINFKHFFPRNCVNVLIWTEKSCWQTSPYEVG